MLVAAVLLAAVAAHGGDYSAFRRELRAFYPDLGQGWNDIVKEPLRGRRGAGDVSEEGCLDSMQDVDGANHVSILKLLALTIHRDPAVEAACGLELDPISDTSKYSTWSPGVSRVRAKESGRF